MRSSTNSLKTVSFNTPRTSDLTRPLNEEEIEEKTIFQYIMSRYVAQIMIGFIIIATGIWVGIYYLTKND